MSSLSNLLTNDACIAESLNVISESDIQALESESMGWVYLSEGAYLHEGKGESGVIQVVGIAQPSMNELNILWLL